MGSNMNAETQSFFAGISFEPEVAGFPDYFSIFTTVAATTAWDIIEEDDDVKSLFKNPETGPVSAIAAAKMGAQVAVAALVKAELLKPEAVDKITYVFDKPMKAILPEDDEGIMDDDLTTLSPLMHEIFDEIQERTIQGSKE